MSEQATEPEQGSPEWYAKIARSRHYSMYALPQNIEHIGDRIERLVHSGRRMTLVEHIGESTRPYRVVTGLTLAEDAHRQVSRRNQSVSVELGPGIHGFGVFAGDYATLADLHAALERVREIRDRESAKLPMERRQWPCDPEHTRVTIDGGIGEPQSDDRIVVERVNSSGVHLTMTVAFDSDPLHLPPCKPWSATSDPDGEYAADLILQHTPDHVRWAVLWWMGEQMASQATADGQLNVLAGLLSGLDEKVRPWAYEITEEAP